MDGLQCQHCTLNSSGSDSETRGREACIAMRSLPLCEPLSIFCGLCSGAHSFGQGIGPLDPGFGALPLRLPGTSGVQACRAGGSESKIFPESMTHIP